MRKRFLKFVLAVIVSTAILPFSVNASSLEDISQIIRQAQAQAISNLGGITANDAEAVMEESKRILREEYGINIEVNSSASDSLYDLGYDDGYEAGYEAGMHEAERRYEAEKEEMRNNRLGAYFSIFAVVAIFAIVTAIDRVKYRNE